MQPAAVTPKKEKILIVESDTTFGAQVADALKKAGYESLFLMKTAADGLKAIYDYLPHLVILDVTLSDGNGYSILAKKQSEPLLAKIPLFLMSTQGTPIDMSKVPANSVKEFLISIHVSPTDIVARIDRQFGHDKQVATATDALSDTPSKKVLWVEDDRLIGSILAKKLTASGFDLFHAKSGQEAIEAMKQVVPDAIVLDLVLPGMSGFDILQVARQDPRLKNVPAMILSNLSKQSDIERAKALGAQKFLVKASVSLDQIVDEVRGLCK